MIKTWLLASRPKTLLAAFVPVAIGGVMAARDGAFHLFACAAALFGAVFIQIGTNFFNDYADAKQGADTEDRKGPTRAVASGLISSRQMLVTSCFMFALSALCCVYMVMRTDWRLALLGAASIACGFWYTAGRYSLAYLGLGDLFVILFFGPVAVGGTYFVQADALPDYVLIAGLAPGLIATGLLAINNLRDIDEDRLAHKHTLAVRLGAGFARWEYLLCVAGGIAIPLILAVLGKGPWLACVALLMLLPCLAITRSLFRGTAGKALNPLLGKTAGILLGYGLLFCLGWYFG